MSAALLEGVGVGDGRDEGGGDYDLVLSSSRVLSTGYGIREVHY